MNFAEMMFELRLRRQRVQEHIKTFHETQGREATKEEQSELLLAASYPPDNIADDKFMVFRWALVVMVTDHPVLVFTSAAVVTTLAAALVYHFLLSPIVRGVLGHVG